MSGSNEGFIAAHALFVIDANRLTTMEAEVEFGTPSFFARFLIERRQAKTTTNLNYLLKQLTLSI